MDIRHCFVPYLPGIFENETLLLNDKVIAANGIESEPGLSFQTRGGEGGVGGDEEILIGREKEKMVEMKKGVEIETLKEKETEAEVGGSKNEVKKEVEKKVVIMAKHLCGVATDLALRSLDAFIIPTSTSTSKQGRDLNSNGKSSHNFIIKCQLNRN